MDPVHGVPPLAGCAVTDVNGAAAEPVLPGKRQVQADPVRQGPDAAAHDGRHDEQAVFVYQPGRNGLSGQVRAAHGEVAVGRFLQPPTRWRGPRS